MKRLFILLFVITPSVIFAQKSANKNLEQSVEEVDTIYKVLNSKEIAFFNGYEAPERIEPDFVLKEDEENKDLKIDKGCDVSDIRTCVSLYHILPSKKDQFGNDIKGVQKGKGYQWVLRSSKIAKDGMEVTFAQKIGKDGEVVYSTVDVEPGEIVNMGRGSYSSETGRYVWIVSAKWK